jgi:hypothetical protein
MHRRRVIHNGVYTHYPSFPYRHHGVNVYSSYDILPTPNVNICIPPYYHDYGYRRGISYIDYPYYDYIPRSFPPFPPIVQTNVQNDIYYYDDPDIIYDDEYGHAYRLSRSQVQLVDLVPKKNIRTYPNRMVVSTYQPKEPPERIMMPRSTVVRHTSLPVYRSRKPVRVVPLYHSADPQYIVTSRT